MAVATRPNKSSQADRPSISAGRALRETEAPDRGRPAAEAPEARSGRAKEAPDAGEGRMNTLEHEFTHGRSQS